MTFLDRYGVEVGRRGIKHDDAIPFDELPDHFIKAVLATEDRRFFSHFGIDVIGTLRALTVNAHAGGVVQGGSSITQQLAKNLFLTNERSISRKIKEAYLALWLEHHLTKKQILGLYLDRAYMGGGAFGVQAAAQYYFGKSARDINLAEAAMLAGLFKAPTKYSPNVNLPAARARANDVLEQSRRRRLHDRGPSLRRAAQSRDARSITAATAVPTGISISPITRSRRSPTRASSATTACSSCAPGSTPACSTRPKASSRTCCATTRPPTTRIRPRPSSPTPTASCARSSADATMARASSTARPRRLRQPGSSFKIFVYLTALMTGKFHGNSPIDASSDLHRRLLRAQLSRRERRLDAAVHARSRSPSTPRRSGFRSRSARPIGRRSSPITSARSPPSAARRSSRPRALMGLTTPLADTVSLPVGADEVKMIDMVGANAILANGGKRATPYAAIEIRNSARQR